MFVLVMRDGSRVELHEGTEADAMREAVRRSAAQLEGGPLWAPFQRPEMLNALGLGRPGLFDHYGRDWTPPTDAEVRELLLLAKLTSSTAGQLVGVPGGKVRKWAGKELGLSMPYAVWRLLSVYVGLAEPDLYLNK